MFKRRGDAIVCALNPNMVLDIEGANRDDGAQLILYPLKHGADNQAFEVTGADTASGHGHGQHYMPATPAYRTGPAPYSYGGAQPMYGAQPLHTAQPMHTAPPAPYSYGGVQPLYSAPPLHAAPPVYPSMYSTPGRGTISNRMFRAVLYFRTF